MGWSYAPTFLEMLGGGGLLFGCGLVMWFGRLALQAHIAIEDPKVIREIYQPIAEGKLSVRRKAIMMRIVFPIVTTVIGGVLRYYFSGITIYIVVVQLIITASCVYYLYQCYMQCSDMKMKLLFQQSHEESINRSLDKLKSDES